VSAYFGDSWRDERAARFAVESFADAALEDGAHERLLAEAMILQGWMLITGATESEARQVITSAMLAVKRHITITH